MNDLDRHLQRVGATQTVRSDATAHYQANMLRYFLAIIESALDDEGVDRQVAERVLSKVMYGCTPQPYDAEQRKALAAELLAAKEAAPLAMLLPDDPRWSR